MKALLICPSIHPAVCHLAETGPLVTAPVLGGTVVSHWIEHLAMLGARQVRIVAVDRVDQVRASVGDGARWGVQIEVVPSEADPLPAPNDAILMSHLPGNPDLPLFESYAGWFEALLRWLPRALTPARVRVAEIRPGIYVGRRARVSRTAELIAPCWIGDQVFVEPGAVVGPGSILEDRAVIESEARVAQSWVGPDTFVGPLTAVTDSLAWGSTLINWQTDSSLRVPDPFLMCSLARPQSEVPIDRFGRALAKTGRDSESHLNWIGAWHSRLNSGHELKLANPAPER